ncbi:hypothetical protein FJ872_24635 [Mesorhizobium sp. B2-5-9]|nr:hypothetical protein A9K65_030235 [Mesorhizobium sp. WSM1497]PBC13848.1 hypothetical protein CK225_24985 [Mesorhizobium loti]TPI78957.1 hypothetical protein FJ423_15860 [Mesorhizobium sp. B2-8-9]TPJ26743.1 hypothetical protein FJ425_17525 [Mesorhizobium sp. B2-7-2]TPJ35997.1 hypothetical protein FJ432_27615 [Mesorhizobium sp. B2-6-5]TPJ38322.1 hypothetical protein FJ437_30595 [Mesorhizobium sp. B2-6-6]TPJ58835.1 hypothetical protein FJ462_30505 [Mesorhizobium sp. B2-6-7]TPJ70672.1 hypothe
MTIAKWMRWRTIHKRAQGNPYMRSSPKETATAAIPIHRVHPPSFWKGMILAATVIVLVPSSQVSAKGKGQTVHHIDQAASVGWERKKMEELPAGTKFNHANRDGVWGGRGQSGHTGDAIWMTSENDVNTARGYAGSSGKYFVVEAKEPLKLAVMDEQGNQVFPDELGAWAPLAQRYGLDGVKTEYGSSYEVILFHRSKIAPVEERGFD